MIARTKESWRLFKASKPGHRFRERYRRQQESEHGWRQGRRKKTPPRGRTAAIRRPYRPRGQCPRPVNPLPEVEEPMHIVKGVLPVLIVALVFALTGCGGEDQATKGAHTTGGGSEQAPKADLDAALKKSFKESDAPGVVAAVQTPRYTWVRALGVADRASEEPMTPEVYHRIGSVTKTFTATLLLQAADEELLSLDDTIG